VEVVIDARLISFGLIEVDGPTLAGSANDADTKQTGTR
jgi:hypothetical protein